MAGREVVLRGWVVKRERAVHGAAFRLRATAVGPARDPAGETRPLRELVQVRARSMDPRECPASEPRSGREAISRCRAAAR